jgi:hypothetical protein
MREFSKQLAQTPAKAIPESDEPRRKPRMFASAPRCSAEPSPEWQLRPGPAHVASCQFEGPAPSGDTKSKCKPRPHGMEKSSTDAIQSRSLSDKMPWESCSRSV